MNRTEAEQHSSSATSRVGWVSAAVLLVIYGVCLVNAGIAIDFTRRLNGPRPESLDRRYGDIRQQLDGVERVAYASDSTNRFLGARYALAPTILDISYIELRREDRSITGYRLDAIADEAQSDPPLRVVCDFSSSDSFSTFVDDLSAVAAERGLRVEVTQRAGSIGLLSVGG